MKQGGLERFMTMHDDRSTKIAHVFLIKGNSRDLLEKLPRAFMNVVNRHPKMRTTSIPGSFELKTLPKLDLTKAQKLVTVVKDDWRELIRTECDVAFNRLDEIPYKISIIVENESESRLILWSDHYMADGHSGLIIMNDLLANIRDECIEMPALPIKRSIFDHVVKKNWFIYNINKLLCKILEKPVLAEMKGYKNNLKISSKLPSDPLKEYGTTYSHFGEGKPENLQKSIAKCREEKTTLNAAAMVLVCATIAKTVGKQDRIKLQMDIDYNMRNKVKGLDEKDVGFNITIGSLESLKKGLDLNQNFWKAAKKLKKESLTANTSFLAKTIQTFVHLKFNKLSNVTIPHDHGCINDVNLSNIGRYPFERKVGDYYLDSFHVFNTIPGLGPSVILYLCTTDRIAYSMASKVEESQAKIVFDTFVFLLERIHEIESHFTIAQVIQLIN
ncbi:hypothetical protein HDV04_006231 [Boothiomyces sp. JEL0838]|nr:hypothetical protein HDV04_006231 [Boothiomyces sp. JEL0838]